MGTWCEAGTAGGFPAAIDVAAGVAGLGQVRDGLRRWFQERLSERQLGAVLRAAGRPVRMPGSTAVPGPESRAGAWVQAWVRDGQLHLTGSDTGIWKQQVLDPAVPPRRGRGLMAAQVDRLEFRIGPAGTVVELTQHLDRTEDWA